MSEENKLKSRKFIVWVVQTIISISVIAIGFVIIIKTSDFNDNVFKLIELAMGYFALISGVYLGVNLGQKLGLTFMNEDKDAK